MFHLGAGHGELMETFANTDSVVMGCEPVPGPTRLARETNGLRPADACIVSARKIFYAGCSGIGQKSQAIFSVTVGSTTSNSRRSCRGWRKFCVRAAGYRRAAAALGRSPV